WAFADGNLGWNGDELRYVALAVTLLSALLMVSRIRFWSFKGGEKGPRADRVRFLQLAMVVLVLAIVAIEPARTLFAIGVVYALSGPA
ncbi:hypothetical protein, partial [Paraburkholderia sp. SIMBA_054]|uniref:hypothetical protein n=1 Tax=Paraburkholderia sp. SIMBA_054 TaxID=3085795 RepID=UPI00397B763F